MSCYGLVDRVRGWDILALSRLFVCPIYVHRLVVVVLLGGVILIDLSVRFSDLLSSSAQEVDKAGHHGQGTRNVL
jgi:hypothetical protein